MNKIFKVIWNQATQSWVAVSELQKAKGKAASKTDKRVVVGAVAALTALTTMSGAYAAVLVGGVALGDKVNLTSPDGSVVFKPATEPDGVTLATDTNGARTLELQVKRGLGISLDNTGGLTVATTKLDQHADSMRFSTPRGQQNKFVKADDLTRHLNSAGFQLTAEAEDGGKATPLEPFTEPAPPFSATAAEKAAYEGRKLRHLDRQRILTGDTLAMIAGNNMNITQVEKGFEFAVEGVNVTYAGNKATEPKKEDGSVDDSSVATVKSVAEAINHSGFTLKTSATTGGEKLASSGEEVINPADTIEMIAGKNLTVKQDEGKVTYATKDDVTFTNVTSNTIKVPTGTATTDKPITINNNGIDMADKPIINVAGNLDGAKIGTTAPTKTGVAPTNLNGIKNNAATVGDVLNAGWNLQVTGNPASNPTDVDFVSPYDSVNFKAGTGVLLGQTSDGKKSTITISLAGDNGALRASDGSSMTGNPMGRIEVVENPTGMVNAGNVANMINKSGFSTTATLVMPNGDRFEGEESLINPGDQVNYVDGKNTKANVTVEKVTVPVTTFWVTETVNGKDQKVQVEPTRLDANGEVIEAVYAVGSSKAGQPVDLTSADKLKIEKQIESVEHDKFDVSYDVVTGETEVPTTTTGDKKKGKAAVTTDAVNNALQAAKNELETAKQGGDQTAIEAAQAKVDAAQKAVDGINNAVATVGDIVETINNVAWYTNSTTATGDAADTAIKAGGRVNLEAGKNVEVTQKVDTETNTVSYTYSTKEEVDFNKITVSNGDNLVDGEGNKVTAETDPATGDTIYKNEAGDVVNAADLKPANTVNLANEAGKAVTNAATDQDASKPAPSALNISGTDAAGNASPTQITGVASTLNTKAVETSPAGKDQPKGSDNLVDLENAANPTSAATVGDLQNMGWVVSASGNEYKDTVKNANEVKFEGKGLATVTGETDAQGVRTITVNVNAQNVVENAQNPVVYTNADGDKVYKQADGSFNTKADGSGNRIKAGDVIASMNAGNDSTNTPTTLSNVKSNLAPVTAVNEKQPNANSLANLEGKKNNAATVEDVLNAGWNLQNNDTAVDTVTHNDAVNFINGRGTTVSVAANDDGTVNNIQVDSALGYVNTDANDTSTPSNTVKVFGKDDAPVKITNVANGDISPKSTDVVNGSQLNNYTKVNNENIGTDNGAINIVNGNGTTVTSTKPGEVKVNVNNTDLTVADNGTINVQDPKGTGANYVNATTVAKAVNNVSWNVGSGKVENTNGKSTYTANADSKVKAGETVKVRAGRNIEISGKGKEVDIAVSDNPEFTSVKTGDTVVNNEGITINNGAAGNSVSLTKNGLNNGGNRITNVKAGEANTDAVNVGQLKGAVGDLNNKINRNQREARAGIAGAAAIAGLPEIHLAGKSMLATAASTYKGENAIAVGYSRLSDNSKVKLKITGSADTKGDFIGTVGVGYAW